MSRLRTALAIAVTATLLAACGGDDDGGATADAGGAAANDGAAAADDSGDATGDDTGDDGGSANGASSSGQDDVPSSGGGVLRISDPGNHGPAAYAKREGILEERLAEVGGTIEWGGSYPNSTASFEAVRSGALNVFGGNTTVTVGYLSVTDNAKVVGLGDEASPDSPPSAGLFVQPDGPIQTIQDLEGTRIGVNIGGYGEYLLLLGLEQAGVDPDAVERVNLQADEAAAAFVGGSIDGYVAIVNAFQPAVEQGFHLLFSNRDVPDRSVSVVAVREELAEEHPEVVKVYLDVLAELFAEQRERPEDFQNVFHTEGPTALSGERLDAAVELARHALAPHVPTAEDIEKFQSVADVFHEAGAIPQPIDASVTVVDINELVDG